MFPLQSTDFLALFNAARRAICAIAKRKSSDALLIFRQDLADTSRRPLLPLPRALVAGFEFEEIFILPKHEYQKGHKPNAVNKGGRPKGSVNKTTTDIREAFKRLIELNIPKFEGWLTAIAEGETAKIKDANGKVIKEVIIRKADPAKAMELMHNLAEYNIPKLARTELTGQGGGPVIVQSTPTDAAL